MMYNLILFDTEAREHLLPLTATRPMAELRVGATTIREKWERALAGKASYITKDYLSTKYPIFVTDDNWLISAGILPTEKLVKRIQDLQINEALLLDDELVAARLSSKQIQNLVDDDAVDELEGLPLEASCTPPQIQRLWDLTRLNQDALLEDITYLTKERNSAPISDSNQVIGNGLLFVEEGVQMEACTINTSTGPVYLGKNTTIMEGCLLRGPIAVLEGAVLKMGAKIYGPTVIGPGCKAGGEITRSIMMANSNKAHDGFLGDSVLGEWCNLGADTNNSNLKNNYSEVKLWDYATNRFERSGSQFVGLFMGDHSKCAINTMFNTGTVAGIFANIYGAGFQRNFIPDFSWGGPDAGYRTYKLQEALETAALVMQRRGITLDETERTILEKVFENTETYRTWSKDKP